MTNSFLFLCFLIKFNFMGLFKHLLFLFVFSFFISCQKNETINSELSSTANDSLLSKKAIKYFETAESFFEKNNDSAIHYLKLSINENDKVVAKDFDFTDNLFYSVSKILQDESRYKESLLFENQMLSYFDNNASWSHDGKLPVYSSIGKCYLMLGEYEKSLTEALLPSEHLFEGLIAKNKDNEQLVTHYQSGFLATLNYIVLNYQRTGNFDEAQRYCKKLEQFDEKAIQKKSLKPYFEDVYSTIIDHYIELKNYEKATVFIEKYKQLYQEPLPITLLRINDKEAKIALKNNAYQQVILLHNAAEKIYLSNEKSKNIAKHYYKNSLERLGKSYLAIGDFDAVIKVSKNIEQLIKQFPSTVFTNVNYSYSIRAEAYQNLNQMDSAVFYYQKIENNAKELQLRGDIIVSKSKKAKLFFNQEKFDLCSKEISALKTYFYSDSGDKVHQVFASTKSLQAAIEVGTILFDLYVKKGEKTFLIQSNEYFLDASKIQNVLSVSGNYSEFDENSLHQINHGILETLFLSKQKNIGLQLNENLEALERNQTLALIYKNRIQTLLQNDARVPKELVHLKNSLERNYYKNENEIFNLSVKINEASSKKIKELKAENISYSKRLDSIYAKIESLDEHVSMYLSPQISVEKLQQKIEKREVVLRYFFSDENLFLFQIDSETIAFDQIAPREKMQNELSDYLHAIKTRSKSIKQHSLHELTTQLNLDGKEKLTIVPHLFLQFIPFESLQKNNRYLVEDYAVGYQPSLHFLMHDFVKRNQLTMTCFSPDYKNTNQVTHLPNLKSTTEEVDHLTALYSGKNYLGKEATVDNFMKLKDDVSLLHLAMHTQEINQEYGLLFSGNTMQEALLPTTSIYGCSLNTDLTVLSACETGIGKINPSEGVMSLSRAFMYSGSKSTLMSLWRVPDEETAKLMSLFYENINHGLSKDEALKKAKISYLDSVDDELLKHPYYWAGFVINGDSSPLVSKANLYWFLLVPVLFLVFFYWKKKNPKTVKN